MPVIRAFFFDYNFERFINKLNKLIRTWQKVRKKMYSVTLNIILPLIRPSTILEILQNRKK